MPAEEKVSGAGSRGMQQRPHGGDGSAAAADHPLVLRNTEGSPWWRRQRSARGLEQPVTNFRNVQCSLCCATRKTAGAAPGGGLVAAWSSR